MAIRQIPYDFSPVDTSVPLPELKKVMQALSSWPEEFNLNPKIERQVKQKAESFKSKQGIDWGLAEQLAFGSLMLEGTPVRLSGQDSERGTFSHRHAVWYDSKDRTRYVPLLNMEDRQGQFCVYNSLFQRPQYWPLIMDTLWITQACLQFGKLSLEILPTGHRLLLTNSL